MAGDIAPSVKNLLPQANEWKQIQTFTRENQGTTPVSQVKLRTTTLGLTGAQQVSPAVEWEAQGFGGGQKKVNFRQYVLPVQGTVNPSALLKFQSSVNSAAFTDLFELSTVSDSDIPYGKLYGRLEVAITNSSTLLTRRSVQFENPSGSLTQVGFSFNNVVKSGFSADSNGVINYRAISTHNFFIGSNLDASTQIAQVYSGGFYNTAGNFNGGNVTAGAAQLSPPATLNTFGSLAMKGVLVTSSTYTLGSEAVVYGDADNANVCSGTPTACNTYTNSTNCNAHNGVGCSWFSGTPCSTYNSTDQSTCETGHSGCTWQSLSCSGANNTDQTTCEAQDDSFGGSCSWDTGTCPSFNNDKVNCQGTTGCTWNSSDCHTFDGQSQSNCESNAGCSWVGGDCHSFDNTDSTTCVTGHTGCSWGPAIDCHTLDGTDQGTCEAESGCAWNDGNNTCYGLCNGTYDEASVCSGEYNTSCTGNLCTGNYYSGVCAGTAWGAECQGTANCGNLTDDGSVACAAESGCSWSTGATWTLPVSSTANLSNTSREYWLKNVGANSNITVNAGSGDTLERDILLRPGDSMRLHHLTRTADCSEILSSTPCNAQTPCSWQAAIVCSDYNGNQSSCESNGCSYDTGTNICSGAGSPAQCVGGTYTVYKKWFRWDTDGLLRASATLNFPSIANNSYEELTITVTGAAVGDACAVGLPAAPQAGVVFTCYVSSTDTVTVRAANVTNSSQDPASATYNVAVYRM